MPSPLSEKKLPMTPWPIVERWLEDAGKIRLRESTAAYLATATRDGAPNVRTILLKGFSEAGFVFFTNYRSRKGEEISSNPRATLLFHWDKLIRQIRIEGNIHKTSATESDTYFQSRPLGSRIGAWASMQSHVIPDRAFLERKVKELRSQFGTKVPRPPHWGGYRLEPTIIEFWQGKPNRLHDRFLYTRSHEGSWEISRLSP